MEQAPLAHIGFSRLGTTAIRVGAAIGAILLVGASFPGGTDLAQANVYLLVLSCILGLILIRSRKLVLSATILDTGRVEIQTLFANHDIGPRSRVEHDVKNVKADVGDFNEQSYDFIELAVDDSSFLISKTADNMPHFLSALSARNRQA